MITPIITSNLQDWGLIKENEPLEERELRLANEHLRYRGSSLKELLNTIIDSDPDEELSVRFKKMDFYDSVRLSEIESELFPEHSSVYNTIEEAIVDSKNW